MNEVLFFDCITTLQRRIHTPCCVRFVYFNVKVARNKCVLLNESPERNRHRFDAVVLGKHPSTRSHNFTLVVQLKNRTTKKQNKSGVWRHNNSRLAPSCDLTQTRVT
jgi:hypothetical protein